MLIRFDWIVSDFNRLFPRTLNDRHLIIFFSSLNIFNIRLLLASYSLSDDFHPRLSKILGCVKGEPDRLLGFPGSAAACNRKRGLKLLATWRNVRFQVPTAASMKFRIVFWDVLPCKIIVDRRFRGTCCLHHQGWVGLARKDGGYIGVHWTGLANREWESTGLLYNRYPFALGPLIPDDGGSTYLWNVDQQLFYTAVYPRKQLWTLTRIV
jgi:hypothetical protein